MSTDSENLRKVFEALDSEGRGYITVEQFKLSFESFANANSKQLYDSLSQETLQSLTQKTQQIEMLINELDPEDNGKIYYRDFVIGISKLLEIEGACNTIVSELLDESFAGSDEDSMHLEHSEASSKKDKVNLPFLADGESYSTDVDSGIQSNHNWPECIGTLDQMLSDADRTDTYSNPDNKTIRRRKMSEIARPSHSVERPKFNDGLCTTSIPYYEYSQSHEDHNGLSDSGRQFVPKEKKKEVQRTWPRRRQSLGGPFLPNYSQRHAYELHSNASPVGSPLSVSRSDLLYDQFDSNFLHVQEQLSKLEQKLENLACNQSQSDTHNSRFREKNQVLIDKIHHFEEQLREFEMRANENHMIEKQNLKQRLTRLDKEKRDELERTRSKMHSLEADIKVAKFEASRYKAESERYLLEKTRADERSSEYEQRALALQDELDKARDYGRNEIIALRKERDNANQILQDLHRELEDLRCRGNLSDTGHRLSISGEKISSGELLTRYREVQELVKRLTSENKNLREQLEELQAEILTKSLEEGRNLIKSSELSIASELDSYSKDELIDMLAKEKDANFKLRDYVEKIITRIMEKQPSLLEIKSMK